METIWILSSREYVLESHQNKKGKNAGLRSIWRNGKNTKAQREHVTPKFQEYVATDFRRILEEGPDG